MEPAVQPFQKCLWITHDPRLGTCAGLSSFGQGYVEKTLRVCRLCRTAGTPESGRLGNVACQAEAAAAAFVVPEVPDEDGAALLSDGDDEAGGFAGELLPVSTDDDEERESVR